MNHNKKPKQAYFEKTKNVNMEKEKPDAETVVGRYRLSLSHTLQVNLTTSGSSNINSGVYVVC